MGWKYETVSASASAGGTVTTSVAEYHSFPNGITVPWYRFDAVPAAGYKLAYWQVHERCEYEWGQQDDSWRSYGDYRLHLQDFWYDDRDDSPNGEGSTTLDAKTTTYTAVFIPASDPDPEPEEGEDDVTVTVYASPEEGGTVSGGGTFSPGSSCTITATANAHYEFTGWTSSNGETASSDTHTFTVPNGDVIWTAHFQKIRVCVLLNNSDGVNGECETDIQGYSSPRNVALVDAGDSVTLLAYVASNYTSLWRVASWDEPDGTTRTVFGTKTSDSITVTLTDAYIEAYAVWKSGYHGYMRYLDWTAHFAPKKLYTFKLEITKNQRLGILPSITWQARIANLVQVVTNTSSKYEARVPHGASSGGVFSVQPTVTDTDRHCVKKATVLEGYAPGDSVEMPFATQSSAEYLSEKSCGSPYGYAIIDYEGEHDTPNGISIEFELGYKTTGELLHGSSGTLLYGSGGTLLHL